MFTSYRFLFSENFIITYYFKPAYYHTLPELLLIVIAGIFYVSKGLYKNENGRSAIMVLSMVLFSILLNRAQGGVYAILLYPVFFFMVFYVFMRMNRLPLLFLLIIAFYIPKYLYLYYRNSHYPDYGSAYQILLRQSIPDGLPVVGLPNDYWAFMERRNFYQICYIDLEKFKREISTAWLLVHEQSEFDNFYRDVGCLNWENIKQNYTKEQVRTIRYQHKTIGIYKLARQVHRLE